MFTSRRTKIIVGVVAAVALLAIGYAAGWVTPRLSTPGTGTFIAGLIVGPLLGLSFKRTLQIFFRTIRNLRLSLVAIMAMGRGYHRVSQERLTKHTTANGAHAPVLTSAGSKATRDIQC